jgi:hypothetical protein
MRGLKFGPARDVVLLVCGLSLLGYETLGVAEPRIVLITIAAAMIGLPATFLADRRFTGEPPTSTPSLPPPTPAPPAAPTQEQAP